MPQQTDFSRGEVSNEIESRYDLEGRDKALRVCENTNNTPQGTCPKRGGFRSLATHKTDCDIRLFPFRFSTEEKYVFAMRRCGNTFLLTVFTPQPIKQSIDREFSSEFEAEEFI